MLGPRVATDAVAVVVALEGVRARGERRVGVDAEHGAHAAGAVPVAGLGVALGATRDPDPRRLGALVRRERRLAAPRAAPGRVARARPQPVRLVVVGPDVHALARARPVLRARELPLVARDRVAAVRRRRRDREPAAVLAGAGRGDAGRARLLVGADL